jgi:hypothetical protein
MNLGQDQREELADTFQANVAYLETRISLLNRRACLHKDEPCGIRARNVITGMIDVINALGFEVVGDWANYYCDFAIVPAVLVADAPKH